MKIHELIAKLQTYPQDFDVCGYDVSNDDKGLIETVESSKEKEEVVLIFNLPVP